MFVFLKVLLFFLKPIVWITVMMVAALFTKTSARKKVFFSTGFVLFVIFSNPFIIRKLVQWYQTKPLTNLPFPHYTAGIVLGGFVSYNRADDKGYFNPACDRFIQTALLYKTGKIDRIIVAAGNGYIVAHDFKEADFIKQHFVELGIPDSAIATDPFSKNTMENAINSKKIIDSLHIAGPFLLISSAMHLPRALHVFEKKKMNVVPFPCDYFSENIGNNLFEDYILPSANALRMWDIFLKEICGLAVYKISGKG